MVYALFYIQVTLEEHILKYKGPLKIGLKKTQNQKKPVLPWQENSVGYSIDPICQGCGFNSMSGHMQEATNEGINKWNNKSMSLSLSPFLSL